MKSSRESAVLLPPIDLTPADCAALRKSADEASRLSTDEYFRFLERESSHIEPSIKTSSGWSAFAL
jgi:hypothetical protein